MADNESLVPGFDDAKDAGIKISLNKIDGMPNCLSVILDGYIDTYNSNFFLKQLNKIVDAGFVNLAFNCYVFKIDQAERRRHCACGNPAESF